MNQTNLFDFYIIDSFAGGGGASTGIELATGHPIDIAINHNESAIMMHKRNHPYTKHYREDIWAVDPVKVTAGHAVKLAWFSPDCKHFSRAKGSALVDKKIRGLAWIVLRWAGTVRPDVIMLENVPEFVTWGPVRKGKPIKSKAGKTYQKWHKQLSDLGYKIETKNLCAADYGAPTIRTRFCLIARSDGKPIKFPEPTHAPRDSEAVRSGKLKPWRAAAEVIDFSLPCYSIFDSKEEIKEKYGATVRRPLKPNTLCRIARGLDKFVIKSAEPFIIPIGYGERKGQAPRVHDIKEPLSTVVSSTKQYLCEPSVMPYGMTNNANNAPHSPYEPIVPSLIQYHSEQKGERVRGQSLTDPLMTVDSSNRYGLSAAYLTQYFSGDGHYHSVNEPLATITTMEREGVVSPFISKYYSGIDGADVKEPMPTVTAIDHNSLASAFLSEFHGAAKDGISVKNPMPTITSRQHHSLIITKIVKWDGVTDLKYWWAIRDLLNEYCGYGLADDEIILLNIDGAWYFISDIGLRMLTPRELYDAMGFPHDYIIDRDENGNAIKRADQVARCGNAVCPAISEAMTRANIPECCIDKTFSMNDLHDIMCS